MMIRTKLAEQPEQFQIGEAWHVGRRVIIPTKLGCDYIEEMIETAVGQVLFTLFQLDCDAGMVLVDASILSPHPASNIEDPGK